MHLNLKGVSEKIGKISEEFGIIYAVLFGSVVEGRVTEESYVDIAVKLSKVSPYSRRLFHTLRRIVLKLDIPNVDLWFLT